MNDRKMLAVLTAVQAIQCAAGMFFHEPSSDVIHGSDAENNTEFGFAMTLIESNTLVVGAPKADKIGKIYNCEIYPYYIMATCGEQTIEIYPSIYTNDSFPDQHFYLGSSIVATSEYFFTCAPLWTTKIDAINRYGKITQEDAFGTCFIHNFETEIDSRYRGMLEYYLSQGKKGFKRMRPSPNVDRFTGGTGWSTLIDEENKLLLIAKTSLEGDFLYVSSSHPNNDVMSLLDDRRDGRNYARYLQAYYNTGFGITAGKFFLNDTVYAFSLLEKTMQGVISFLAYRSISKTTGILSLMRTGEMFSSKSVIQLKSNSVGTMFGATMSAADLNMDGLDELLVAASAESEDECFECGALHIYIGGDMNTINELKRRRSIFGSTHFGRFGTAIAAEDIDGDGKLELVVSAPYENQGLGAIYILSGYEVYHKLVKFQDYKSIQLSDMKMTQRIQKETHRTLGFSLQFLPDIDENGCGELAAGCPGNSEVLVFKCVQKINVTLSSQLLGEQVVREQDTSFIVQVCARVQLPDLPKHIVGSIAVENSIIGEAAVIVQPNIVIDIACYDCPRDRKNLCKNVTVELQDKEPGDYTVKSKAVLQNIYLSNMSITDFNESWVETSPHSKLDTRIEVTRHCRGDDCLPKLSMDLRWSGGERYLLGSSANETVTINVRNDGKAAYTACVWLRVIGAPLARVDCEAYNEGYRCYLPKPLKRDTEYSINLMLNMTKPTNVEQKLDVKVDLYENCNQETVIKSTKTLSPPFDLTLDNIFQDGYSHKLNITDKQILDNTTVYDHHEYVIRNNGSILWKKVPLYVEMKVRPFLKSFQILETDFLKCGKSYPQNLDVIVSKCTLDLPPNTTQIIVTTLEILAAGLKGYATGSGLNVSSTSNFYLTRLPTLSAISVTEITIQKEITLSSNKLMISLIAAFVALILLAILTIVLCKCGFFKRKQQQKLLVMKESIRRQSVRRNTHVSATDGPVEGLQMDVDDDSPFDEPQPVTNNDNVGLVDKDEDD